MRNALLRLGLWVSLGLSTGMVAHLAPAMLAPAVMAPATAQVPPDATPIPAFGEQPPAPTTSPAPATTPPEPAPVSAVEALPIEPLPVEATPIVADDNAVANEAAAATAETTTANTAVSMQLSAQAAELVQITSQGVLAFGAIAGISLLWLAGRRTRQKWAWRRADLARQTVEELCKRESFQRVLAILNFEEYRDLKIEIPGYSHAEMCGTMSTHEMRSVIFEATDDRLKKALRRHGEMVMLKAGFNEILRTGLPADYTPNFNLDEAIANFQQEFYIELTLRDWFDDFLSGLCHLEAMIQTNLISAKDLEPYIGHWIQLIADRSYRRETGSNFYDQLFAHIHHAQYDPVQSLFQRFGYTLLPPPYKPDEFRAVPETGEQAPKDYDLRTAILLAKAAYLAYEHTDYVQDIVQQWTVGNPFPNYEQYTDAKAFVTKVMEYTHDAGASANREQQTQYQFFESHEPGNDTQAYAFKLGHRLVVVFRGTQQIADWRTNADFLMDCWDPKDLRKGLVHKGFKSGWEDRGVKRKIIKTLEEWKQPGCEIWVTGHSLGGALATLAAASLKEYFDSDSNIKQVRLYTFGQPRVGNGVFLDYFNNQLGFSELGQRFVNNTDIVPRVPLRILSWRFWLRPWAWKSLYGHGANLRYFNFRKKLWDRSSLLGRGLDVAVASAIGIFIPGWGFLTNHSMGLYLTNLEAAAAARKRAEAQKESNELTERMTKMIRHDESK